MKIKVIISNRLDSVDLKLDTERKVCKINDVVYDINVEELAFDIYSCVCNWPKQLVNERIFDGERYRVDIETEKKQESFIGINKFPQNYREFKEKIYTIVKSNEFRK